MNADDSLGRFVDGCFNFAFGMRTGQPMRDLWHESE